MQLPEAWAGSHGLGLATVARWWRNGSVDVMACQSHDLIVCSVCFASCFVWFDLVCSFVSVFLWFCFLKPGV